MPVLEEEDIEDIFYGIVGLAQLYYDKAINVDEFQELLWDLLATLIWIVLLGTSVHIRSSRSSRSKILELLVKQDLECLEKRFINDQIGFGLFTTKTIKKGDLIGYYRGERLDDIL